MAVLIRKKLQDKDISKFDLVLRQALDTILSNATVVEVSTDV